MIVLSDITEDLTTDFWVPSIDIDPKQLFELLLYDYIVTRDKFEKGELTMEQFKQLSVEFHSKFKIDIQVPNKFNRMISWKSGSIRGQRMISKKQGVKLTHNFYIHTPIQKR